MRRPALALALAGAFLAAAAPAPAPAATPEEAALATYADIARAGYADSLGTARALRAAVRTFVAEPGPQGLADLRRLWLEARVPYMQTEVFRFGNPVVDAWEGRVNAWPLDEGLIDYVAAEYGETSDENPWYTANLVANPTLEVAGRSVDATAITPELLRSLHEAGEVESNVATGYHAIEFLLWGQDLNGTGAGAGERPWTDYSIARCTNGNCDRRRAYLAAATDLLVADLEEMAASWAEGGEARAALLANGPQAGLAAALTGLGSLAYGELAGERTRLGLLLHDPEEEHDCFSDNTHNSHFYDVVGMRNVWTGRYARTDGSAVEGPGLAAVVAERDAAAAAAMTERLDATLAAAAAVKAAADGGRMRFDQMLADGNAEGNALLEALVAALVEQTRATERAVAALGLEAIAFEGSDSLDDPGAVVR